MLNKTLVSVLSLFVFLSTSGLPVKFHLCAKTGISFSDSCNLCEEIEIQKSCCENDIDIPINSLLTNKNEECCQSKILVSKIDENFLLVKSDFENINKHTISKISSLLPLKFYNKTFVTHTNNSPPLKFHQDDLNILNSTLLI